MRYLQLDFSAFPAGNAIQSNSRQIAAVFFFLGLLSFSAFARADESVAQFAPTADAMEQTDQPEAAATPLPAPAPAANGSQDWHGFMSCDARLDGGRNIPGYQARFDMEKDGNAVTIHRRNDKVDEKLRGKVSDDILNLSGNGYRFAEPKIRWQFSFSAELPQDATMFSGKGNMLVKGDPIRTCELVMTRATPSEQPWKIAQGPRPKNGSKFSQLHLGMTIQQVTDLIGPPKDTDSHESGKRWIPFYFGNDARRLEALYENEGCLVFAAGNIFGAKAQGELKEIQVSPSGACFRNPSYDPRRAPTLVKKK